jgi:hypothetical protein
MQETERGRENATPGKTVGIYDRPDAAKSSWSLTTAIAVLVLIVAGIAVVAYRFFG